jgi:hypothetical protein
MANYAREKAKFGGMVGTIQTFSSYLPTANDPNSTEFRSKIPAGYLRCDGSVQSANNYPELADILGTGQQSRFKKPDVTLTDEQFQLPDLGSKYIKPGLSTGTYLDTTLEQDSSKRRVGSEFFISSNVGNTTTITYSGNFRVTGASDLTILGNPRLLPPTTRNVDNTVLTDQNFQAHGHMGNQTVLNYTGNFRTSSGGKSGDDAKVFAGNELVNAEPPFGTTFNSSTHTHRIEMPTAFPHNFTYSYSTFDIPADNIVTTINLSLKTTKTFDSAVAPFILVEYIIKY